MKRIALMLCGAGLMLGAASCKTETTGNFTAEDKAYGDTLSIALGQLQGAVAQKTAEQYDYTNKDKKIDHDQYMKGIEFALQCDTIDPSFVMGLEQGIQIHKMMMSAPAQLGIPLNAKLIVKAFEQTFNSEEDVNISMLQLQFRDAANKAYNRHEQKRIEAITNSPESKANVAAGEEYIKARLAEGYKKTASGLVYKINNPGEDEKVLATDQLVIKYVGRHVNGEEFDSGDAMPGTPARFVPGFGEGLQLLGNGGSATLVIPADLAYGLNGSGDKIGPNETLVFDIEVRAVNGVKSAQTIADEAVAAAEEAARVEVVVAQADEEVQQVAAEIAEEAQAAPAEETEAATAETAE